MQNPSVLISGAGIAGPTLAYWLLARGFKPTLVESAPRLRAGGYMIDFWGLGYDIADRIGLLPALESRGYRAEELRFVDDCGRRVGGFGVDVFRRMTGGRYVSLPRGELAEAIYRTVAGRCEIIFGDGVAGIAQSSDAVGVEFHHAPARQFDLVVGADGLHSAVRNLVFGPSDPYERYLGYAAAAFEVEGYRPRDEGVYVSHGLPGRQIARFAMRNNRTMFLLVFAAARPPAVDPDDVQQQKAILHREFDGAGWECPQILQALDRCEHVYFDRVSQIRMDAWSRGRVVLVGDAAFCPSLLAGQGAALAMTAAYVLAGELAEAEGRFQPAFERYEALLRAFIVGKQTAAERFSAFFAPKTSFGIFLRNQVSKALRIPLVADAVIGRSLLDRVALPTYRRG
jgi:2-polyprenyl-6-methoxyphenol hydroxylase-like FAD-dependent oxidoreductase